MFSLAKYNCNINMKIQIILYLKSRALRQYFAESTFLWVISVSVRTKSGPIFKIKCNRPIGRKIRNHAAIALHKETYAVLLSI